MKYFFDFKDMIIIKGQDRCYWIYSNERDRYLPTDISWGDTDEEEFVEIINNMAYLIEEEDWIDDID